MNNKQTARATFGGGCFWCTEAVFQQLKGVVHVVSGYAGGGVTDPSYDDVCSGRTGHAEVIQVSFAPDTISYQDLLTVFFHTHDPTTLNQQGADIGTQYRSIIFAHDQQQQVEAEELKEKLDNSGEFAAPITTEVVALGDFYPAEEYHQNFFARNPQQPYCNAVINPKLAKLRAKFSDKLNS